MPSVVKTNGGVSNFGNHLLTVIPYSLGFIVSIVYLVRAGRLLAANQQYKKHMYALYGFSGLEAIVYLSTFLRRFAWVFSQIHDGLGIILFAYAFILSIWWTVQRFNLVALAFFAIQTIGDTIGLITIAGAFHLLYYAQAIGMIGFSLVLVYLLPSIIDEHVSPAVDLTRLPTRQDQ